MLNQPGLEPLSLFILVLFGLLLAFFLVLWTALGSGNDRRETPARQKRQKHERRPSRPPVTAGRDEAPAAEPKQEEGSAPAAAAAPRAESRRLADSDSVVSYSVRPRVPGRPPAEAEPRPVPEREVPPAQPAARQETGRAERRAAPPAVTGRDGRAAPGLSRPAGRDTRSDPAGVERPSEAPEGGHGRSSDAFERFLRRSSDDHDDY